MSGNQQKSKKSLSLPVGAAGLGGLLAVPIAYLLELYVDGKLKTAISLPNSPESVHMQRPTPLMIRHTLGDLPRREIAQARNRNITISGRSGLAARQGYARDGSQFFKPGPEILLEFDAFLQEYTRLCEEKSAQTINRRLGVKGAMWSEEKVYLVFRALDEKVHLRVEPTNWVWMRGAERSRFSYEWQLAMQGYAYAPDKPQGFFDDMAEWGDTAGDMIDLVAGSIGLAANLAHNFTASLNALVSPALDGLRHAAEALDSLRVAAGGLSRVGKSALAKFATAAEGFKESFRRWEEMQNPFSGDMYKPEMARIRKVFGATAEDASKAAGIALASVGGGRADTATAELEQALTPPGEDGGESPALRHGQRYRDRRDAQSASIAYRIRPGDSLFTLAERFFGAAERWVDIAWLNGFQDASTAGDGSTLRAGQVIRVPGDADPSAVSAFPNARTLDDILARDVYINFKTWDLEPLGAGDIRTVAGAANLEQALGNRVLTERGECPLFSRYGLPVSVGMKTNPRLAGYIGAHVQDQMLADPRVVEVANIVVLDEGDTISVSATLTPITGSDIEMITPVRGEN